MILSRYRLVILQISTLIEVKDNKMLNKSSINAKYIMYVKCDPQDIKFGSH
jgi:hypothetical protein